MKIVWSEGNREARRALAGVMVAMLLWCLMMLLFY